MRILVRSRAYVDGSSNLFSLSDDRIQCVVIHCGHLDTVRYRIAISLGLDDELRASIQPGFDFAASQCDIHFLQLESECHH